MGLLAPERMLARREMVKERISHLPPIEELQMPWTIRQKSWVKESKLEDKLGLYGFFGGRIKKHNGKLMPTAKMFELDFERGLIAPGMPVLSLTSGNMGAEGGFIGPGYGVDFYALINGKKIPEAKQKHLRASGAKLLYLPDNLPKDVSNHQYADELAYKMSAYHMDQYSEDGSRLGWQPAMDHITEEFKRLQQTPTRAFTVTGSCSTLYGIRHFLEPQWPGLVGGGIACMPGTEEVPGGRSIERVLELSKVPGSLVSEMLANGQLKIEEIITGVKKREAYQFNAMLYHDYDLSVGPTAALLTLAVIRHLEEHWGRFHNFEAFMNREEKIVIILFFVDMPLPYFDEDMYLEAFESN